MLRFADPTKTAFSKSVGWDAETLPREPANIHQSPITKISHQPIEQIHVSSGSRVLCGARQLLLILLIAKRLSAYLFDDASQRVASEERRRGNGQKNGTCRPHNFILSFHVHREMCPLGIGVHCLAAGPTAPNLSAIATCSPTQEVAGRDST